LNPCMTAQRFMAVAGIPPGPETRWESSGGCLGPAQWMPRWVKHGGGLQQNPLTCVVHIIKGMMYPGWPQPTSTPPMAVSACEEATTCLQTYPNSHSSKLCRMGSSLTWGAKCCILQICLSQQCSTSTPTLTPTGMQPGWKLDRCDETCAHGSDSGKTIMIARVQA
jgi:hypothetical protein